MPPAVDVSIRAKKAQNNLRFAQNSRSDVNHSDISTKVIIHICMLPTLIAGHVKHYEVVYYYQNTNYFGSLLKPQTKVMTEAATRPTSMPTRLNITDSLTVEASDECLLIRFRFIKRLSVIHHGRRKYKKLLKQSITAFIMKCIVIMLIQCC